MFKKVLEVLGVGRDGREEENCSGSSCCSSSDSEVSWHSVEPGAEELEIFHGPTTESDSEIDSTINFAVQRGQGDQYYGPNESDDSAASTSSWHRRKNVRVKRFPRRNKGHPVPEIQEERLREVVSRSRQLTLDNEALVPEEDRLQRSKAPGRLRGGYESFPTGDLKTKQIQKLHSLNRLDEDWGYLLPEKLEKKFSWPWKTLTEQQVALGKLEFTKFIVVLSCCQEWQSQPEIVLTMDQICTLHQIPLEEIETFLNHEIAISKGVQNDRFPHIKKSWLKDQRVSYECHLDKSGSYTIKIVQPKCASTLLHRVFGQDRVMPVFVNELPDDASMIAQNGIIVGLRRYRLWSKINFCR